MRLKYIYYNKFSLDLYLNRGALSLTGACAKKHTNAVSKYTRSVSDKLNGNEKVVRCFICHCLAVILNEQWKTLVFFSGLK